MKRLSILLLAVVLTLSAISLSPSTPVTRADKADPVVVAPESVGLATSRLANIRAVMSQHIANKKMAGASALIARHGKVAYQEAWGMADTETGTPMKMDTIHRIYSMTKPITSVALMMLYEEGKFQLNDPIAKFMPEFAKMMVAVEERNPNTGRIEFTTVPAKR